jgi:uncharacterized protein YebE (UPF0316 family)
MDYKLLALFIVLNIINVIISTIKSIATVKCGKGGAAVANALGYGFYTIVVVYMVSDLPLWAKVLVVGGCNLVGVYIVKAIEEKIQKEKLWKIELTVRNSQAEKLHKELSGFKIPHNYIENVGKWTIFNVYCATKKESAFVKEVAVRNNAKFFANETKIL